MNRSGYGGVAGGLRPVVAAFDPELVLVSPLARALQTALVATEGGGGAESVPILVHPALAEVGGGVGPHATPANTCKHLPHLAGGPSPRPAGVGGTASLGVLLLLLLLAAWAAGASQPPSLIPGWSRR
jgi:broad specificity phosphatase PhoE